MDNKEFDIYTRLSVCLWGWGSMSVRARVCMHYVRNVYVKYLDRQVDK